MTEEVRKYHIPDFSNWKNHGAFERAFARLEKALRASIGKQIGARLCEPQHIRSSDVAINSEHPLSGEAAAGRRPALHFEGDDVRSL